MQYFWRQLFFIAAMIVLIGGCSHHRPAPVVVLNSQPNVDTGYSASTYKVKSGDTLFAIAWYTGHDYRDIARYNNLKPPYTIFAGQTLSLKPPSVAKRRSAAVKKGSQKNSGPISKNKPTNNIDPPKQQAYGESENIVNNQPVKPAKSSPKSVTTQTTNGFPDRVVTWIWPAKGKLVGTFSDAESGNKGIDIQGPRGSAIYAAAAGKVVYSGSALRGYGNLIIIKHTETFLSAYAHNDTIEVKEQQWVDAGQRIATMGNSGTDSVKLHFEVRYRGKSLDPLRYLPRERP